MLKKRSPHAHSHNKCKCQARSDIDQEAAVRFTSIRHITHIRRAQPTDSPEEALYLARAPSPAVRTGGRAGVPVSVAVASRQDVPIYLTGIGSVQAYFTIDIHTKVDGELQEVLFTEGQRVKKGDVLAKIDPRLYQAALDQAKAKRAQDAAMLVAAEKDLARAKALAL
ncbi:MAG TPA: biotin/lipoyl-binding protein, partial [Methylomirabilota bacterium]|nr:biotin/lipoyl-binding protein [Methylomirabilota bacterium]